jgi:hypothetical protein
MSARATSMRAYMAVAIAVLACTGEFRAHMPGQWL